MTQVNKTKTDSTKNTTPLTSVTNAVSGAGMDRKVTTNTSPMKKWLSVVLIILIVVFTGYMIASKSTGKVLSVDNSRVVISKVTSGVFEDFIPIRGRVTPAKTVYLDAIEGGRVEKILVEDGASLTAGNLIVELSNASLQLSVLGNETRVAEQLNNMRSIELNLEQNRLQHKRNIVDIKHQIKLLTRQVDRSQSLIATGAITKSKMEDTEDTLIWYQDRLALTIESQQSDARMQGEQLTFLRDTSRRLESNLAISRQNLDNMNVKAPVAGKLSGFNVEVGQSIARGERLGQIDTPNDYKLTAFIDEFYLGRVDIGQTASYQDYSLVIAKVYPQVQNGQFEVDFKFIAEQPKGIRRGQTIQIKLTLGDASEALLIPNGAFFQDTGGKWMFVVSPNGSEAVKRNVRLGRRNNQFIEVIEGLELGEQVVTSPYSSYQDMQRLNFN
ncbi:HlyD family efflux transporter periplasmic adaptor subunit [Colwellia demingiae]|uniref:HlyD family efflux transporter periplasmic adaptor subunit n=1 Tax=Colwellia demingiae TaxID=89401 RepID=A0A5C6QQ03_9GAMM|nr:HlyD family efflux transporter periplasmic adaptor subunit [Colwellia demingiae]TWX70791.1 HlyD family efflux transporter periplasmic adaptor subunit [Colwellia demingiae]